MSQYTSRNAILAYIVIGLLVYGYLYSSGFKFSIFGQPKYSDWRFYAWNSGYGNFGIGCQTDDPALNSGLAVNEVSFCEFSLERNKGANEPVSTGVWLTLQAGEGKTLQSGDIQSAAWLVGIRTATYHYVGDGVCDAQAPYLETYQNSPLDCPAPETTTTTQPGQPPTTSVSTTIYQPPIGGTSTTITLPSDWGLPSGLNTTQIAIIIALLVGIGGGFYMLRKKLGR